MALFAAALKIEHKLLKFKYPKLLGLVFAIILAYWIFSKPVVAGFFSGLNSWGYFGSFIGGLLFSFGFTSPFAAGMFITLNPKNIILAGILGGVGAMISDLLIFNFVKASFMDEFKRLERTSEMRKLGKLIDYEIGHKFKVYLMYALAGFFIASPLPDEAGVIMLAGLTKIKQARLALISWACNTIGILVLLLI